MHGYFDFFLDFSFLQLFEDLPSSSKKRKRTDDDSGGLPRSRKRAAKDSDGKGWGELTEDEVREGHISIFLSV
jgi:hypothetical protein